MNGVSIPNIDHILVGVDGSEHSDIAVSWTLALVAGRPDVRATVVCAFDDPFSVNRSGHILVDGSPDEHESVASQVAAQAAERLTAAGVAARAVAFEGTFVEAVLSICHREAPDCVVIGCGQPSAPRAWVLGSTAQRVIRFCPVPVFLAR